jgi:hypothetical protein
MIVSPIPSRKYWEMIADKLHSQGWSWGMIQARQDGVPIWIVNASKDGQRHIVRAEEITVAFLELERSCKSKSITVA